MGNTQVLCFLILFAEDVDPDKVLRRYHGLDLEVRGFVKGAQGAFTCSLSLACGVFSPILHDAIFYSSTIQSEAHSDCILVVRTQNGDAIRAVPARDRVANTEHEPLAFEC